MRIGCLGHVLLPVMVFAGNLISSELLLLVWVWLKIFSVSFVQPNLVSDFQLTKKKEGTFNFFQSLKLNNFSKLF